MNTTTTLSALKSACIKRGLPITGCKSVLMERLQLGYSVPFHPSHILSLDLGSKNCAAALLNCSNDQLLQWSLTDLHFSEINSKMVALKGKEYFNKHIQPNLTKSTLIVVEKQRLRTAGGAATLDSAVIGILMETVLATLANDQLVLVDPKSVAKYYNMPTGYREKKKASVNIVMDRLQEIDEPHVEYFKKQKKRDDLADALLQAWAVKDWLAN